MQILKDFRPLFLIIYLAFLGMLCVSSVLLYLGDKPNIFVGIISMGLIFFVYLLNRYTDITEDFANDIGKYMFFSKRKFLLKLGFALITSTVILLIALQKLALYHLLLIGLGLIYSYRLIPWYSKNKGLHFYRLKEFPLVKNLIVSFMWGISIFLVPIIFVGHDIPNKFILVVLMTSILISTFNNTLYSDIRDESGDRLINNITLPILIGYKKCFILLSVIDFAWVILAVFFTLFKLLDIYHLAFLTIMAFYPAVYIYAHFSKKFTRPVIDFLSESDLLIFGCGLALLSVL